MSAAFWLMVAVVSTALFAFISVAVWVAARQQEREAHYRDEMARRIAEAGNAGPILEYVRETAQVDAARVRTKARIAGLITAAVGIALMIFLYLAARGSAAYLVGLIPLLVGVALLTYSELMTKPKH
jgi:Domain of unknown function (DUF6249)